MTLTAVPSNDKPVGLVSLSYDTEIIEVGTEATLDASGLGSQMKMTMLLSILGPSRPITVTCNGLSHQCQSF